jgi:hypothetical protein
MNSRKQEQARLDDPRSQPATLADIQALQQQVQALTVAVSAVVKREGVRLSRTEVARRLGVTTKTLRAMIARGDWPPPGPGGRWLMDDVIAAESQRKH